MPKLYLNLITFITFDTALFQNKQSFIILNAMILIFSESTDISTKEIKERLRNMSQEVLEISMGTPDIYFEYIGDDKILFNDRKSNRTYNLLEASACWWRRTGLTPNMLTSEFPVKIDIDGEELDFLIQGERNILRYEVSSIIKFINNMIYKRCPIHIGNPNQMGLNRLLTLEMAKNIGLKIPRYAIITNLNQISNMSSIGKSFVVKAIEDGLYHFYNNKAFYSYTEAYIKEDMQGKNIPLFPSLIMEKIEKKYEIRSFYLDGHFYSMCIFSQNNIQTEVDFRKYCVERPNKVEPYKLPANIEKMLDELFHYYDLNCGSVDIVVDKKGNYVFLEINPVGQFQMTSTPCNYNIEQIIANYLTYGTQKNNIYR